MAALTVGTTESVEFVVGGTHEPTLQNLGPGTLYIDWNSNVTTETGLQIPVGAGYEPRVVRGNRSLWLIASQVA